MYHSTVMQTVDTTVTCIKNDHDNDNDILPILIEVPRSLVCQTDRLETLHRKIERSKARRRSFHRIHSHNDLYPNEQTGFATWNQKSRINLVLPSQTKDDSRRHIKATKSKIDERVKIEPQEDFEPALEHPNRSRIVPSEGPNHDATIVDERRIRRRRNRLSSMRHPIRHEVAASNARRYNFDQQQERQQPVNNSRSNELAAPGIRIVSHSLNNNYTNWNEYDGSERRNHHYFYGFDSSIWNDNRGEEFIGFIPMFGRLLFYMFQMYFLLAISAVTYYTVYHVYAMPRCFVNRPLYFDYMPSELHDNRFKNLGSVRMNMQNFYNDSIRDEMSATVTARASVDLTKNKDVAWESHLTISLSGQPIRRILDPYHKYYIELLLDLPDTHRNRHGGMFGIRTELYTASPTKDINSQKETMVESSNRSACNLNCIIDCDGNCQVVGHDHVHHNLDCRELHPNASIKSTVILSSFDLLATSHRSSRYPYVSSWIDHVQKVLFIIPLLLHTTDESKTVHIFAFRHYMESFQYPLVSSFDAAKYQFHITVPLLNLNT
jgi:Putative adipose-regulatory protein (Seipin)